MPELPEVEITARRIDEAVRGATVESVLAPGMNVTGPEPFFAPRTVPGAWPPPDISAAISSGTAAKSMVSTPLASRSVPRAEPYS